MSWLQRKFGSSDLGKALLQCKFALFAVAGITAVLNITYLTGSIYMLEVYDRVIPGRSLQTLIGLSIIVAVIYLFQGVMDVIRMRLLLRVGIMMDQTLRPRVFDIQMRMPILQQSPGDPLAPTHDADTIRNFISGQGLAALFDLPWIPFYLVICFLFHPAIGYTALFGAVILLSLALASEIFGRHHDKSFQLESMQRTELALASVRNAEAVKAMGMQNAILGNLNKVNRRYLQSFREMGDVIGGMSSVSRVVRMAIQSAVLGVGAYLVIYDLASAGVIIASSILTSRALAPVEQAIGHWRSFMAARSAWARLDNQFRLMPPPRPRLELPAPYRSLKLSGVSATPPASKRVAIADISFELEAGSGLGIVGPSASGKSSLVRVIVGAWPVMRGSVRIDGATLDQWPSDLIGRHIGYLPQLVELFNGSVADNISRFDPDPDVQAILKAADMAGVHDMILGLPDGYETQIGQGGMNLSAGQRQRVALARALYRDPFLVILDEPNSNLDATGERALIDAIGSVRKRGGIVIIVAHHSGALAGVEQVLVMSQGRMIGMGTKDEVMRAINRRPSGQKGEVRTLPSASGGAVKDVIAQDSPDTKAG